MTGWRTCVGVLFLWACNDDKAFELCDDDGDGFVEELCAEADPEGPWDCDDTNAEAHPGGVEACDDADNDCNGVVDDGEVEAYMDADGDGFGAGGETTARCGAGAGWALVDGDCDDGDATAYPKPLFTDGDGDGFGDVASDLPDACVAPEGTSLVGGDCNDHDPLAFPGATEWCDGADDDCDGQIDDEGVQSHYRDFDGDGEGNPMDAVLGDCDPMVGYSTVGTDCDDTRADVAAGHSETCDERDNDCDGEIDEGKTSPYYRDSDGDAVGDDLAVVYACVEPEGYVSDWGDCDDADAETNPYMDEICDGSDNNCDGQVDEGLLRTVYPDVDRDGHGVAAGAAQRCDDPIGFADVADDCDDARATVYPGATEVCDVTDNDCDGAIDEGAVNKGTWYRDQDGDGYGAGAGTVSCAAPDSVSKWSLSAEDCNDSAVLIRPGANELCDNGVDENCDDKGCELYGTFEAKAVFDASWTGESKEDRLGTCIAGADAVSDSRLGANELLIGAPGIYQLQVTGTLVTSPGAVYLVDPPSVDSASSVSSSVEVSSDTSSVSTNRFGHTVVACDLTGRGTSDGVMGWNNDNTTTINDTSNWDWAVFARPFAWTSGSWDANATRFVDATDPGGRGGDALVCGDFNGDGLDDLAIGAPYFGTNDAGAVYVVNGRSQGYASGTVSVATASGHERLEGVNGSDHAGKALAVGDLNGDGKDDLVVGAPDSDNPAGGAGAVYVRFGPIDGVTSLGTGGTTLRGEATGDTLGSSVAVGDFDGDGFADLVAVGGGTTYLFFGKSAGWVSASVSTADDALAGASGKVTSIGDVNGDGYEDLALGSSSSVRVWYGGLDFALSEQADLVLTGVSVVGRVGDVDDDGRDDLVCADPTYDTGSLNNAGVVYLLHGTGM